MIYEFKEQDAYDFARHMRARVKPYGDELRFTSYCPYCNGGNNHDKDTFSINLKTGQFKCLRSSCSATGNFITLSRDFDFSLGIEADEYYRPRKQYKKLPTPKEPIIPKPKAVEYLLSRGISEETAKKYELTIHAKRDNILVFPFFDERKRLQYIKYRDTEYFHGKTYIDDEGKTQKSPKEYMEKDCKPILFGMKQCNDRFDRMIITEGQCFRGDAEIMTPSGWIRLEDYAGQDVLQIHDDLTASFIRPRQYIVKRHAGKMVDVSIGGNYFSSTTDDHNLVFQKKDGTLIKKRADEKITTTYHVPTTIQYDGTGFEWTDDMIALYLAVSADGALDRRKNTGPRKSDADTYARFGLTKQRKIDRLTGILDRIGIRYSHSILKDKRKSKDYHSICFCCPKWLDSKYLPWEFVTKTSVKQKKFIIEEMVHWDGNHVNGRNQYEYMSIVKNNADVIQAVSSMCGYMSTIMKKSSGGNGPFKKGYTYKVSVLLGKHNISTQQYEKRKVFHDVDEQVYCVTVNTGMILVRQNNCISVSGNCDSLSVSEAGIENAVSVPGGMNNFRWVPYCWNWVCKFEEIVVFGDFENGHMTLLEDIKKRFPNKIRYVQEKDYQGCKDANELLQKHGKEAVRQAVENAILVPVERVIELADVEDVDIYKLEKLSSSIGELDHLLYGGLPFGGVVLVSGKPGEGKSTLASQILAGAIDAGYKTMAYSGELPNYQFKAWIDFQIAGPNHIIDTTNKFGTPYRVISKSNRQLITEWYRGKAYMYDNRIVEADEKEDLLKTIENTIMQYETRVVLIDNLMTAIDLDYEKGTDKYEKQSIFMKKLARIALKHDVLILVVAHKRKNNFSTNENDEISGSGDISNLATVTLSYGKDKDMDASERMLRVSKNRLFGKTNTAGYKLLFDEKSKRIYSSLSERDRQFGWDKSDGFVPVEDMELVFDD